MIASRSFRSYATRYRSMSARSSHRGTDGRGGWAGSAGADCRPAGAVVGSAAMSGAVAADLGRGRETVDAGRLDPAVGGPAGAGPASGAGDAGASVARRLPPDTAAGDAGAPATGGVH